MANETLFDESEQLLNICWDNVFKAVFTKESQESRKALSRLVSAIIGRDLEVLGITANEPAPESVHHRQIRFDINCKTTDGEQVNVEMCLNPDDFEPARLEYYGARLFGGQNIRGEGRTYSDLKPTHQIAILVNKTFFPDNDFFHSFEYHDPVRRVSLGGLTRIHTLELGKLDDVCRKPVDDMSYQELWAVFFRYLNDPNMRAKINQIAKREEGIKMAGTVLLGISRNEAERARLESEYKAEIDLQSKLGGAERKGRLEGRQEGWLEGRQERDKELLHLIAKGYTAEDIRKELEAKS
ncbi:MAG: Rpn family recombination-promoting nuclease/putative transposase [Treponema sp.]|nr:Rpn family recombination-promoting nuclease/putative transposase [Treponema sp.]